MKTFIEAAGVALALATLCAASAALAQESISNDVVKLGLIMDMSGPFSDQSGKGSVTAAEMAVEDFGGTVLGKKIEVLSADSQIKPDVASTIARKWFDTENLDAIMDLSGSAPSLAALSITRQKEKMIFFNAGGSTLLTNEQCAPYAIQYTYNTRAVATSTANALIDEGGKSWFFIAVDSAFGESLVADATAVIKGRGGSVVGSVKAPVGTTDFSSYALQAQASGADVVAIANGANDTINAVKSAFEFGLNNTSTVATLILLLNDVKAIGLQTAQGIVATTAWYWDRTPESREFAERFYARMGAMPNMLQAGVYSSTSTYLKAVQEAGTDETKKVREKLATMKINDMFATNGYIREDGQMVHEFYLVKVKSPAESTAPWDLYSVQDRIPGETAFAPLSESRCPTVQAK